MLVNGFGDKITWSKFKQLKSRPTDIEFDGETITLSKYAYKILQTRAGYIFKDLTLTIFVDTKSSWVVEGKMSAELLKHEQGHYDISALGIRDLTTQSQKFTAENELDLKSSFDDLKAKLQSKIDDADILYDTQTHHSQNKAEQDKWNKAIANEKQKADGSIDNLPK